MRRNLRYPRLYPTCFERGPCCREDRLLPASGGGKETEGGVERRIDLPGWVERRLGQWTHNPTSNANGDQHLLLQHVDGCNRQGSHNFGSLEGFWTFSFFALLSPLCPQSLPCRQVPPFKKKYRHSHQPLLSPRSISPSLESPSSLFNLCRLISSI